MAYAIEGQEDCAMQALVEEQDAKRSIQLPSELSFVGHGLLGDDTN